jgi:hypothetical protein
VRCILRHANSPFDQLFAMKMIMSSVDSLQAVLKVDVGRGHNKKYSTFPYS